MLVDLQPQAQQQDTLDLLEQAQAPRGGAELMNALDALNRRFGRHAVTVGGTSHRAGPSAHASRQERRSPRYTTRLEEIASARA
jgi:DNA polymerase V